MGRGLSLLPSHFYALHRTGTVPHLGLGMLAESLPRTPTADGSRLATSLPHLLSIHSPPES